MRNTQAALHFLDASDIGLLPLKIKKIGLQCHTTKDFTIVVQLLIHKFSQRTDVKDRVFFIMKQNNQPHTCTVHVLILKQNL